MFAQIVPRSGCVLVLSFVFLAIFSLFTPEKTSASNHIIYVNAAATGGDNGSDWANAFTDLQDALAAAGNGDEIWVAAGTYKPGVSRGHTFQLQNGVAIYGGFAGTELVREARAWQTNVTILSGDINNSGDLNGNSYNVVTGSGTDTSAILDGFTITAGNTTGALFTNIAGGGMHNSSGSPTVANVIFSGNIASGTSGYGGGMYNATGSSPTLTNVTFNDNHAAQGGGMFNTSGSSILTNVTFSGNSASFDGGAMNNFSSSPILTNVTFRNNSAGDDGGAIRNWNGSNPTLINVIFSGNRAGFGGGGIHNTSSSDPTIQNSIFWNNSSSIVTDSAGATIRYSLVEGLNPAGEGNLDGTNPGNDPLFIDMPDPGDAPTLGGDLRLQSGSPVIDAGNDTLVPAGVATDLAGLSRIIGSAVDMGAYESQYEQVCGGFTAGIPYVIGASQPITLTFSNPGTVDCVAVTYFPTDHLEATGVAANIATGHYWTIAATGSGFTAVLALPHDNLSDPKACRWLEGTGPGAGWDCARNDFTNSNVIRHDITQFSDWAVGNEVGPTAITLQFLTAVQSGKTLPVNLSLILLLLLLVVATTGLILYRNMAHCPLGHSRDGQTVINP